MQKVSHRPQKAIGLQSRDSDIRAIGKVESKGSEEATGAQTAEEEGKLKDGGSEEAAKT